MDFNSQASTDLGICKVSLNSSLFSVVVNYYHYFLNYKELKIDFEQWKILFNTSFWQHTFISLGNDERKAITISCRQFLPFLCNQFHSFLYAVDVIEKPSVKNKRVPIPLSASKCFKMEIYFSAVKEISHYYESWVFCNNHTPRLFRENVRLRWKQMRQIYRSVMQSYMRNNIRLRRRIKALIVQVYGEKVFEKLS